MKPNRTRPSWMTDTVIRRLDTPCSALPIRPVARRLLGLAFVAALLASWITPGVAAAPAPLDAKVIWAGNECVVITARDSIEVSPGDLIHVLRRGKVIAEGQVNTVFELRLAVVGLFEASRGSLRDLKRLDQLRLQVERRTPPPLSVMRVGFPSASRSHLLFECRRMAPRPPEGAYQTHAMSDRAQRWVLSPESRLSGPWPDTLLITLFDESADEEIALERGDLDIAVFWPGELSAHARGLWPRNDHRSGDTKVPGLLGVVTFGADTSSGSTELSHYDRAALHRLWEELFSLDIMPLWANEFRGPWVSPPANATAARFEVDRSCPGWQAIERFLNAAARGADRTSTERIWVFSLDVPWHDSRAIALGACDRLRNGPVPPALRARADSLAAELRTPGRPAPEFSELRELLAGPLQIPMLYTLQCQTLYPPAMNVYVQALGAWGLANLLECVPAGRP